MCGRYTAQYTWRELVELYRLTDDTEAMDLPPRFNMSPGADLPIVRVRDGRREVVRMRWGYRAPWWSRGKPQPISATAERLFESGMSKSAARRSRCMVSMQGFYEPKGEKGKGPRPLFYFHHPDDRVISVAGVWTTWHDGYEVVESFAIVTVPANKTVGEMHHRMPAILDPAMVDAWLDPDFSDADALRAMLRPWDGDPLKCWEVSSAVNKRGAEGPELIEPKAGTSDRRVNVS